MKGIQLKFKDKDISVSTKKGMIHLIFSANYKPSGVDEFNVDFLGNDLSENKKMKWLESELKLNEEVIISVKKIKENSTPIEIRENKSSISDKNKKLLDSYRSLKDKLTKKGLLINKKT